MTDVNHLAFLGRYCGPSTLKHGIPKADAFWVRSTDHYLSVNVLPDDLGVEEGLAQIRKILAKKRFGANPNGRFAVFNAGRVVQYVRKYGNVDVRIKHMPSPDDPTHAGIAPAERYDENAWYRSTRTIARLLSRILRENPDSVYPVR